MPNHDMSNHVKWIEMRKAELATPYRHDTHLMNALREVHILIEELMDERSQWRDIAERFYKVSYCDPDCKGVLDEEAECSCGRFPIGCDYEELVKVYPEPTFTPPSDPQLAVFADIYLGENTRTLGE